MDDTKLAVEVDQLADRLELLVSDDHGNYSDHYLKHEDCKEFDRIEWLRDTAYRLRSGNWD